MDTFDEASFPPDVTQYVWEAPEVLSLKTVYLSEANLEGLSKFLACMVNLGEVWALQQMKAEERVCSYFDEVEFGEQAKFTMYEVVMNAIGVEIPFFRFLIECLVIFERLGVDQGFIWKAWRGSRLSNVWRITKAFGSRTDCSLHFLGWPSHLSMIPIGRDG